MRLYYSAMLSHIPQLQHLDSDQFFLIAGPCAIEGRNMAFDIAGQLKTWCTEYRIPFIFKGSYRKANRTKLDSFRGIGDQEALEVLGEIRDQLNVPVTTDIHSAEEAVLASKYVDMLQIPAFLCRQTDLLLAAAATGKVVNIKKGQFLGPQGMKFAIEKVMSSQGKGVMLTERGTTFGYQDLVVDFRSIPEMQSYGHPVILDCTHSLQQPNQSSGVTGGRPSLISTIAKAGIAAGVDGLFIETHPNPKKALSDGANMLSIENMPKLLNSLTKIRNAIKQ